MVYILPDAKKILVNQNKSWVIMPDSKLCTAKDGGPATNRAILPITTDETDHEGQRETLKQPNPYAETSAKNKAKP